MSYYKPQQSGYGDQYPPQYNAAQYGAAQPQYGGPQYGAPQYNAQPQYDSNYSQYSEPAHPNTPLTRPAETEEKFARLSGFRDPIFTILFLLHFVGLAVLLAFGIKKSKEDETYDSDINNVWPAKDKSEFKTTLSIFAGAAGFAIFISFVYLKIVQHFAKQLIYVTIVLNVMLWAAMGVWIIAAGQIVGGIFTLVIAGFMALFFYWWRTRIPFATQMLTTVSRLTMAYPGTTYLAFLSLPIQFAFIILWAATVTFADRLKTPYVVGVFLVLSFYWTSQVIKNVVHVSVSGTFATWYFLSGTTGVPPNPTLGAFKRATTTSFGSICFGSLIVAMLQTLRAMLRGLRNERNGLLVLIVDCLIGWVDGLVQYFNVYAFTQVAIYGKTYCRAAKDTWQLVKSHGAEAIINDNLISGVLTMGCFLGGIMTAIFGGIIGRIFIEQYWGTCAVAGFFIGFVMLLMTMEVVNSGVACIFVCFALDPEALRRNDVELYTKFRETYGRYLDF